PERLGAEASAMCWVTGLESRLDRPGSREPGGQGGLIASLPEARACDGRGPAKWSASASSNIAHQSGSDHQIWRLKISQQLRHRWLRLRLIILSSEHQKFREPMVVHTWDVARDAACWEVCVLIFRGNLQRALSDRSESYNLQHSRLCAELHWQELFRSEGLLQLRALSTSDFAHLLGLGLRRAAVKPAAVNGDLLPMLRQDAKRSSSFRGTDRGVATASSSTQLLIGWPAAPAALLADLDQLVEFFWQRANPATRSQAVVVALPGLARLCSGSIRPAVLPAACGQFLLPPSKPLKLEEALLEIGACGARFRVAMATTTAAAKQRTLLSGSVSSGSAASPTVSFRGAQRWQRSRRPTQRFCCRIFADAWVAFKRADRRGQSGQLFQAPVQVGRLKILHLLVTSKCNLQFYNFLEALWEHVSALADFLAKIYSSRGAAAHPFDILAESPSSALGKLIFELHVSPTKLEDLAARLGLNLSHIIIKNSMPKISIETRARPEPDSTLFSLTEQKATEILCRVVNDCESWTGQPERPTPSCLLASSGGSASSKPHWLNRHQLAERISPELCEFVLAEQPDPLTVFGLVQFQRVSPPFKLRSCFCCIQRQRHFSGSASLAGLLCPDAAAAEKRSGRRSQRRQQCNADNRLWDPASVLASLKRLCSGPQLAQTWGASGRQFRQFDFFFCRPAAADSRPYSITMATLDYLRDSSPLLATLVSLACPDQVTDNLSLTLHLDHYASVAAASNSSGSDFQHISTMSRSPISSSNNSSTATQSARQTFGSLGGIDIRSYLYQRLAHSFPQLGPARASLFRPNGSESPSRGQLSPCSNCAAGRQLKLGLVTCTSGCCIIRLRAASGYGGRGLLNECLRLTIASRPLDYLASRYLSSEASLRDPGIQHGLSKLGRLSETGALGWPWPYDDALVERLTQRLKTLRVLGDIVQGCWRTGRRRRRTASAESRRGEAGRELEADDTGKVLDFLLLRARRFRLALRWAACYRPDASTRE
uniref:HECT domain-containing protein n=1 Tax=Macrostomum lignano TaxID=282301 RepID=A0A1I8FRB5_9PLAT